MALWWAPAMALGVCLRCAHPRERSELRVDQIDQTDAPAEELIGLEIGQADGALLHATSYTAAFATTSVAATAPSRLTTVLTRPVAAAAALAHLT